jgi:DNA-directed RNA polymerase subunit RPC12/RpoP
MRVHNPAKPHLSQRMCETEHCIIHHVDEDTSSSLAVRCPHCNHLFDEVETTSIVETQAMVECPHCGGSWGVVNA